MKILIAEDESVSRVKLQRILEKWNYEVISTRDGVEAFEAFRRDRYSMVITDWEMPHMDGISLVQRIRQHQQEADYGYVYILMLTAKSEKQDLVDGMEAGADDFVSKPFDNDELRVRLRAGERIIELEENLSQRNTELAAANDKMTVDLHAAAQIQNSLLPPEQTLSTDDVCMAWQFIPCDELAGDILNIFRLNDQHLGFYVLDVSGHGVPAALMAVTLSRMLSPVIDDASLLKTPSDNGQGFTITSPEKVADQLNKRFQIDNENGQFFTMLYGILNTETRSLSYVTAGHPGMIYLPAGSSEPMFISAPSLPIGFLEENRYEVQRVQLHPGDRLYVYSDGIPEAENPTRELFSIPRMEEVLMKCRQESVEDSLETLIQRVNEWSQSTRLKDDATLLGIEIKD